MPTFRADYIVTGDLVLPNGTEEIRSSPSDSLTIIFKNAPPDSEGHITSLIATVIGPAESIKEADEELRHTLAQHLDLLAFSTHSRFQIADCTRVIEWEAGKKHRFMKMFHTIDARYPSDPQLDQEQIDTIKVLEAAGIPSYTRIALKYFRYGLLDYSPEDQFMRLWLALEIIAENVKEQTRAAIPCPSCGKASLICQTCNTAPERRPMARQAIEFIINSISKEEGPEICKRQFTARNGLMHGRSSESIEKECKVPLADIVDELGALAWKAILHSIPQPSGRVVFGHRDGNFVNGKLVAIADMSFDHTENADHPSERAIPSPKMSWKISLKDGTEYSA